MCCGDCMIGAATYHTYLVSCKLATIAQPAQCAVADHQLLCAGTWCMLHGRARSVTQPSELAPHACMLLLLGITLLGCTEAAPNLLCSKLATHLQATYLDSVLCCIMDKVGLAAGM
jgi:hypothetical protein